MKLALSRKNLWERLPKGAKKAIGLILGAVPPRYLIGRGFRKTLRFLEDAQWWPKEQAEKYQLDELRRVCSLAYERAAFYRESFRKAGFHPDDLKTVNDISQLPTIDRGTIKENLDRMITIPVNSSKVDYITTGGTSGEPLCFYTTSDRSEIEYAYLVSSWRRVGYNPGAPMAVFRGKVITESANGLWHEHDPLLKHHYYSTFHMSDVDMRNYLDHIKGIGPCFLHVYPSSVANLARFIRRSGIEAPQNIVGILAESENVYPDQRRMVEDVFERRYFSSYGHTEKLIAAAECEGSTDYHVWPTYGFFELLDREGQPVTTPGQRGEIVGTGFINHVVPFIRYRTGDYATYIGDRCNECGREHTVISDIRGHNIQENLIAFDGSLITWAAVNMHDDTFDKVQRFQFYQDTPGKATLKIIAAHGFGEAAINLIQQNLGRKFGDRLEFSIQLVDEIPLSNRGKSVYVDQRIAQ